MAAKPLRVQRPSNSNKAGPRGKIRRFPLRLVRETRPVIAPTRVIKILGQVTKRGHTYRAIYDTSFPDEPVTIVALNTKTKKRTVHRLTHEQYLKFQRELHATNPTQMIAAIAGHPEVLKAIVNTAIHL
ncbi:MAG: hypothetical protein AABX02_00515 [archaeon]